MLHHRFVLATAAALALVACGDSDPTAVAPAAPTQALALARARVAGAPAFVQTAQRTVALDRELVASITLRNESGELTLPAAGLRVRIPAAALPDTTQPITITVTALAGRQLAYEFQPSGTRFRAPLEIEQDVRALVTPGKPGSATLVGSYFRSPSDLSLESNSAASFEVLPATLRGATVTIPVWHFSGYTVGWGRTSTRGS